jgi:hypothetical protein
MRGLPLSLIGSVTESEVLNIYGLDSKICVEADIDELKQCWQKPLDWR